jgi:hypothetical protein
LIAIDISPLIIDYGNLEATEISPEDVNITITNFGNLVINISVDGYGVEDGDNLAMNCTKGNISINNERYSTTYNTPYSDMTILTDTATQIINFTLPQRTNDSGYDNDQNMTFWKLQLPSAIQGTCNGTVRFTAVMT